MLETRIWRLWVLTCGSLMGLFILWEWSLRDELAAATRLAAEVSVLTQAVTTRLEQTEVRQEEVLRYATGEFERIGLEFERLEQTIETMRQITDEHAFRAKMLEDLDTLRAQLTALYALQERPE